MPDINEDLITQIAWMYYEENLTHQEISEELHLSRVKVTRLLQTARELGIVQIKITRPLAAQSALERRLKETFRIKYAVVVETAPSLERTVERVGEAGANLLVKLLFPNCRLGLAWGSTLSVITKHLEPLDPPIPFTIHEVAGTYLAPTIPYGASWLVAHKLSVPLESLPVPTMIKDEKAMQAILNEENIRQALEHARQVDIAFVGLGNLTDQCTLIRTSHFTVEEIRELRRRGAVGDILMRFYDNQGQHVPSPYEAQIVSLTWPEIKALPHIVALAAGKTEKGPVILGALRGHIIHSLVTDSETAEYLLEESL
jgi:DNA-binding transcriptional regulator LsrR (DeoR family)